MEDGDMVSVQTNVLYISILGTDSQPNNNLCDKSRILSSSELSDRPDEDNNKNVSDGTKGRINLTRIHIYI